MSQEDLEALEGQINDYKRTPDIFNQAIAMRMIDTLNTIKDSVLPEDEALFNSVRDKLITIAFPPVPIVPVPPPLNPADITPLLNEIMML
jgi:hypothetical protein